MTRFPYDNETCPNCLNQETRETKGMVCQSCGHDHAPDTTPAPHPASSLGVTLAEAADAADAAGSVIRQAGMSMATAKREAGLDPFPAQDPPELESPSGEMTPREQALVAVYVAMEEYNACRVTETTPVRIPPSLRETIVDAVMAVVPAPADRPPAELAGTAAEAIRALNHATINGSGYRAPSDVDATIAELESLAWRLQQTIRQAYTWLRIEHAAGRVGHDAGPGDTDTDVRGAVAWMDYAVQRAGQLGETLNEAHRYTAHLTGEREVSR